MMDAEDDSAAAGRRVLPCSIVDAIKTLRWSLEAHSSSPMRYQTLEHLADLNSSHSALILPTGEDVLSTVASLKNKSTPSSNGVDNDSSEAWARIATALILLGHGYADEAHNLVGPLSFPEELPYFHVRPGPPVSLPSDAQAAASLVHCLVHRREGPHVGEFGRTGFQNADFWAGAVLRSGGEESLPLAEIRHRITRLTRNRNRSSTLHTNAATGDEWMRTSMPQYCEWDPRPLTELCATVQAARHTGSINNGTHAHDSASATSDLVLCGSGTGSRTSHGHALQEFAEQAALVELKVLLKHVLTKLGYDTTATSLIMNDDEDASTLTLGTFAVPELPHTFDPTRNQICTGNNNAPPSVYQNQNHQHALVVTTAASPHRIVHVNQAWLDLCGFSTHQQAEGQTFSIIQGPESNTSEGANMVRRCHETLQPQEAYLVNYTASGERFINHVTIGPLFQQQQHSSTHDKHKQPHNHHHHSGHPDWFVGILEKVT